MGWQRWWMIGLMVTAGCRFGDRAPRQRAPHFHTIHGLITAGFRGDIESSQWIARTLAEERVDFPLDAVGIEQVGGGLGFVQIASDNEDVAEGIARALGGCAACHQAEGLSVPALSGWTHKTAGLRLMVNASFPPLEAPEPTDAYLTEVRAAWDQAAAAPDAQPHAALAAALAACSNCHTRARQSAD